MEKFDETRRRSRGCRRRRSGVDGEIGGGKGWKARSKASTVRRRQRAKMRRARKREDIQWSPTTRRRPEGRRKIEGDERRTGIMERKGRKISFTY